MKLALLTVAGCFLLGLAGCRGTDNAATRDKLVGEWESVGEKLPLDATSGYQFTRDGIVRSIVKIGDKTFTQEGTYEVDGDQIRLVLKSPEPGLRPANQTIRIKSLTDTEMVIELRDEMTGNKVEDRLKKK
jgi:uncharacterized protein (TIGR03066 family)